MKKILQKTTLALAVAAASTGAMAGDLAYTAATSGAVVMANEVFGAGSEETLVAVPDVTFTVDVVDALALNELVTVKFTLDSGAVFGEDLSSLDKWEDAGVTLVFATDGLNDLVVGGVGAGQTAGLGAAAAASGMSAVSVTQGGAIGDNTVTFQLTVQDATDLTSARVDGFKVKNLTAALERGVANPAVRLGAEYRNVTKGNVTDTDTALVIFSSQDGVELTGTLTDYTAAPGGRARIDVADTELSFTGNLAGNTGANAAQDFDETDNVAFVTLGDLQVVRSQYTDALTNTVNVKKEDANDFDFNGSDTIDLVVTSSASLASYSSVYLRTAPGACSATTGAGDFVGTAVVGDPNSVNVSLTGETTAALSAGYTVCGIAAGTAAIPESTVTANLDVNYFNPRYTNSQDTLDYGQILRNGCQVTLFNVPNPTAGDKAFIRLTNVSEKPGAVRAYMWDQNGTQIDLNSELVGSLAAHATVALNTNPGQAGYLGDNMPTYAAQTSGRNRLVIQGAFPACEALGLVRTPANVLTNMTSTTYSGDSSRLGAQNNGTSNTSN
ncbi:hypothetical protein [Alkalimarinus coralli]|uniref:hypothetical protein n=1 Tax=Alkalimarinus coralli TaxID=2935863 RepID=UPI00202B6EAD|nr:hypothetical protein [Alkalimarinus coralli]